MKLLTLMILLLTACGREKEEISTIQTRNTLDKIKTHYSEYNPNSYKDIYLNMKVEHLTFTTKSELGEELAVVEIKPSCEQREIIFMGKMPQGPYTTELDLINGASNLSVQLKCLDDGCSSLIVALGESNKSEKAIYPLFLERNGALWIEKWNPEENASNFTKGLNQKNLCHTRVSQNTKLINLFVDHDLANDDLGFFSQFSYQKSSQTAERKFIDICHNQLKGKYLPESLNNIKVGLKQSLRLSFSTFQFEHDDFIHGQCQVNADFSWDELYLFEQAPTDQAAIHKVQQRCTSDLNGYIADDYKLEALKVSKSGKWLAKLKCLSLKQNNKLFL